ncbi:toxin-antitoxin system HicB family antitoxin [Luteimonas terrae]|uniref:Toxin-antitoxin system HicB family antitoxin n=1 Tax=Luteimonas terrae TaxID=1530191 RepID=A0A4R5UD79_9GAMM|nr:toxin-antitoxin system HicB family antitoxin [Luteimonas terrae]TDK33183.1 toxin-antitoxin system HicB family antitoxin [Luteimonas terrae]
MNAPKPEIHKLNLRLPPELKQQLQIYADSVGVSLNAACLLAIRNYLPYAMKGVEQFEKNVPKPSLPRATKAQSAMPHRKAEPVLQRRVGRNESCPCMSGKKAKVCHPEWT